jgi:hypothetical protein
MRLALKLHPGSHSAAAQSVDVVVARLGASQVVLRYVVTGAIADLAMPPPVAPSRADELWRHTCFEVFVCPAPGEAYYEFNFSPSTQWAAYRFDGYRKGMRVAAEIGPPRIEASAAPERYTLQAALELTAAADGPWRVGLAAVIEHAGGRLSYWALAHPPGRPDFHRVDCFTCEI